MTQTPTPTPSNTPSVTYVNECNVFTLFPLGIECFTVAKPSSPTSSDGILSINITGGTTPYYVYWSGGDRSQTLSGIPAGDYEVTVVDYYGDFTATTVCTLVSEFVTPTPSVTPTITPSSTPTYDAPDLCLNILNSSQITGPIQFVHSGNQNNKPTYVSGSYLMYWNSTNNRWEILNWDYDIIPVSSSTSDVPTSGWILLGDVQGETITIIEGSCPSYLPLNSQVVVQNTTCVNGNDCNGSIIVNTSGGQKPYQYSINGGNTYQTSNIFNGLCEGTYSVIVKDSQNIQQQSTAVVGTDKTLQKYNLIVTIDSVQPIGSNEKITNWSLSVNPELPDGVVINFDLNLTNLKQINGPGSGIITINNNLYKNNVLVSPDSVSSSSVAYDRPSCSPNSTEEIGENITYSLSITKGDSITGTTYASVFITDPQTDSNGCITTLLQRTSYKLSNGVITGCECCELIILNRTPQTTLTIENGDRNAFL